jgi:DNA invertase Pin-like site-specific DNA recombinase
MPRDPLGRDVIEVAMIQRLVARRRARIVSAAGEGTDSDDPTGMLMRRLINSFAEYERLIIGARTKAALGAKKLRNERVSRFVPFGKRLCANGQSLEPELTEQAIIGSITELRTAGFTLQAIADELNRRGLRTRAGTPWRRQDVHRDCGLTADGARRLRLHQPYVYGSLGGL